MTYGQDERPDQYRRPGYGQQYRPEDQPWQPPNDPRQYQGRASGPQEAPWQQTAYPQQEAPWQAPYPPQDYPPRDQWQPQQTGQDYGQFQPPPQQHHRKRSRAPLFAGIAAVIVVAGGGTAYALAGHGGSPGPVSALSSPATPTPAATPDTLSQLKKLVLQSADLPSGWKGAAHQADPNDSAETAAMYKCLGMRDTDSDKVAEADSDDFSLGNATISSSANSYRSQSDIASDVAMLHSPKLSPCFGQMLTKQLAASSPAGTTIKSASIKVTPGSAGGPANVAATGTGTIKVEANGQEISLYMNFAFITGPLIEASVEADNLYAPEPASVLKPLVATVAARVNKG